MPQLGFGLSAREQARAERLLVKLRVAEWPDTSILDAEASNTDDSKAAGAAGL